MYHEVTMTPLFPNGPATVHMSQVPPCERAVPLLCILYQGMDSDPEVLCFLTRCSFLHLFNISANQYAA